MTVTIEAESTVSASNYEDALKTAALLVSERSASRNLGNSRIGAAVLSSDGRIFDGAYIAGATSYTTVHAEAVAIIRALSAGVNAIVSVALYASQLDAALELYPCGTCLQLLAEHGIGPEVRIYTGTAERPGWECICLGALLPKPWKSRNPK